MKKKTIIIILVLVIIVSLIWGLKSFFKPKELYQKPKVIDKINGYELMEGASSYFKNVFSKLREELSKREINNENYAKLISQLFISDCYTLDNKISNNDIGGVQFVYEPFRDDFILIANEFLYSHVENNIYGTRKQELPIVNKVKIVSMEQKPFLFKEKTDEEAYYVEIEIDYLKDLEYPKEVSLVIIHNNNKLEIAKLE